jgi:predicted Zn-dependent peptidase
MYAQLLRSFGEMAMRSVLRLQPRMGVRTFGAPAVAASDVPAIAGAAMTTTPAGLRIASVTTPGSTATVTAWVEAGSRYETPETNGVANLLETSSMSGKAAEIAALGGMVSSYTTRE